MAIRVDEGERGKHYTCSARAGGRASGVQQEEAACWRQMAAPHAVAVAGAASLPVGECHWRGDALYTDQIPRRGQGRRDKPEGWSRRRRRRPRGGAVGLSLPPPREWASIFFSESPRNYRGGVGEGWCLRRRDSPALGFSRRTGERITVKKVQFFLDQTKPKPLNAMHQLLLLPPPKLINLTIYTTVSINLRQ
jgi:hypothetical protein